MEEYSIENNVNYFFIRQTILISGKIKMSLGKILISIIVIAPR